MKFCYADESGHGGGITVVVGVVVDALRMHRTKEDWENLLAALDTISAGRVIEIKGRELYRGNAFWREWDGGERSRLISNIINWMGERKHTVTFGAVSRQRVDTLRSTTRALTFQGTTEWTIAAIQLILSVQKRYQHESQNKGKTLFIFDEVTEREELLDLVDKPPVITNGFYNLGKKQRPLDQVIDVPYFADSRHVGLIQVADLFAYILHLYAELSEGIATEKSPGEFKRLEEWVDQMKPVLLPDAMRWPQGSRDSCTQFFRSVGPASLLKVAS